MELKPYMKICLKGGCAVCAIFEPHPYRVSALPGDADIGIGDDEWCWVYYDWCGNPVGIMESYDGMPEGEIVSAFTAENIGNQDLADYLNKEQPEFVAAYYRSRQNAEERSDSGQ